MRLLLLPALSAVACGTTIEGQGVPRVETGEPSIQRADLDCDADGGTWTLDVHTDAWAGGVLTHWTTDGDYVERHRGLSIAAAESGSTDHLRLRLHIVSDWRTVQPDQSTVFTCASLPNLVAVLVDLDGKPVDCRSWGPEPLIWADVEGVVPCPIQGNAR